MKRLIFCFDGTTNKLESPNPTNVVRIAQSITPITEDGITQVIHYDEGVGTVGGERFSGGLFGKGLFYNVIEAYKFLIFNYNVDDEIYVFGFSRGAYTARVFAGLIQNCNILPRIRADEVARVEEQYRTRGPSVDYKSDEMRRFRAECSPQLCVDPDEQEWRKQNVANFDVAASKRIWIRYLGVWDTVRSLGVADNTIFADLGIGRERYKFYDDTLSDAVMSARHAMAIDEKRKKFDVIQWSNVDELNIHRGFSVDDPNRSFQQKWFPGTHGAVGGGGDFVGLSDDSLDWVLEGARRMGLILDMDPESPLFELKANPFDHLDNVDKSKARSIMSVGMDLLIKRDRHPGPKAIHELSDSAIARWNADPEHLPEKKPYRPTVFEGVNEALEKHNPIPKGIERRGEQGDVKGNNVVEHRVVFGDTLSIIAQKYYGDPARYAEIFDFNYPSITNPDRIYIDQVIRVQNPVLGINTT